MKTLSEVESKLVVALDATSETDITPRPLHPWCTMMARRTPRPRVIPIATGYPLAITRLPVRRRRRWLSVMVLCASWMALGILVKGVFNGL